MELLLLNYHYLIMMIIMMVFRKTNVLENLLLRADELERTIWLYNNI